jgi:branched-chain amino acid transport system ATP-binding protein
VVASGAVGPAERLLDVSQLTVRYGALTALRGVSLHVDTGEIVTLLGANGAGKTTLLSSLVGLVPKAGGRVTFAGEDVTGVPAEAVVRRGLTLVREGRKVFAELTVAENLRLGAASRPRHEVAQLVEDMLELFPVLKARFDERAGLLSGGEQQQLAVARALMSRPRLLLLDEPSLGLAPKVVATVFELIVALRERGVTILLVEQNVERALEIADRCYLLNTGQIELEGPARDLAADAIEDTYLGIRRTAGASV